MKFRFSQLFRSHQPRRKQPRQTNKRSRRLFVEHLEDRRLLTTRTWTGNGADDLWSNAANWDGGLTVPTNGDDVVIAATANSAEVLFDSTAAAVTINSLSSAEPFHIGGSILTLTGAGSFTMTAGLTLSLGALGGSGSLTVSPTMDWTGGNMGGDGGTLVIPAGVNLNISGFRQMFGHTINNSGTITWAGSNSELRADAGTNTLNNLSGGVFNAQSNSAMDTFGGAWVFDNQAGATLNKSGAGTTTTFIATFNNEGAVNVTSGTLALQNGGTGGAMFSVSSGGTLNFSGGTYTLAATSSLTGAGDVAFGSNATVNVGGTYNITGNTNINGGSANFNAAASATTVNLSLGKLGGSGTVTVGSTMDWTGGNMGGDGGTLVIPAGINLNISGSRQMFGHTINNSGTINLTGSSSELRADAGTNTLNNLSGGVFNAQNNSTMNLFGGAWVFDNQAGATFNKSGAGTTTTFIVTFNNEGTIDVNSGTLEFGGSFVQTGGATHLLGGAISATVPLQIQGGVLDGNGTITGHVTNSGGNVSPGTSAGSITIDGNYVQTDADPPSGEFSVEIGGLIPVTEYDQVAITGANHSATLGGTLTATLINGFIPAIGNSFTILSGPASGAFDTLNLPTLPADRQWQVSIGSVVLSVVAVGGCSTVVTNTNDTGAGSLRDAIDCANNTAGTQTISFNIPGGGVQTISPATALPTITEQVQIDGGNAGVATDRVQISGGGTLSTGLNVSPNASGPTNNVEIRNLVINGFTSREILVVGGSGHVIQGNFLGLDPTGASAVTNSAIGIDICCGTGSIQIGGTTAAARNVITSAGGNSGINVDSSAATIEGNFIGLNAAGTAHVGSLNGVTVSNGFATIGGTSAGAGNVIVGRTGIAFTGNPALGHSSGLVQGNFIGTDVTGTVALNLGSLSGIDVDHATGVVINGGNVISGNGDGIDIHSSGVSGASSSNTTVQGNFIGTAADGVTPLGNTGMGVDIFVSPNNTVGGVNTGEGNVIAFNGDRGVFVGGNAGNAVLGNSIFGNGGLGIDLQGGDGEDGTTRVTPNDESAFPFDTDPSTGPGTAANNLQNFPDLTLVTSNAGTTTIQGTLKSTASTTFRIEFFANVAADPSGFGEGQTFLGALTIADNGAGDTDANLGIIGFSFSTATPTGTFFTATATRIDVELGPLDTSEFSAAISPQLVAPSVTINQAATQTDPTSTSPIHFTVIFSAAVTDFATGDVTLSGTAGATTAVVTGSGTTYDVAVSGMTSSGTVIATIAAGVAHDAANSPNTASTSTDNTVTFVIADTTAPTVTINQAAGQADPTSTSPIHFTVVFSEVVTDFATGGVSLSGTAGANTATVTGSGTTYDVAVSGMTQNGTVIATLVAGVAHDAAANPSAASTSTDNTVTFDATAPTVTINQAATQSDPTKTSPIHFTVVFSESVGDFATGDVSLSGTASATTATVTGSGTTYDVAVSGMTQSGTVIASLNAGIAHDAAGNPSAASTSTDHTVTFDITAPTVTINQAATQVDPTGTSPIHFTVVFSESVSDFATGDVSLSGTAGATTATVTGSGTTYDVAVSGMTTGGTVIASLAAGVAHDAAGNASAASTSTDHTVTFTIPDTTPPTVIINQAAGQPDPTSTSPIHFAVVFSEAVSDFTTGDISLSGTAGATTAIVTGSGTTYAVAVSGMAQSGTVIATLAAGIAHDAAGNPSVASTSTDNIVTFTIEEQTGLPQCDISTANERGSAGTAVLRNDADNPGQIVLLVTGTSSNDVIIIEPRPANQTQVRVKSTGKLLGIFSSTAFQHILAFGLAGNDTIIVDCRIAQPATLLGGDGNDALYGGRGNDQLAGGNGNDQLFGGLGNDALCGDAGNDNLYGGNGDDIEFGDIGNDHLYGDAGKDLLLGGDGNDFLYGGVDNDQLFGQAGNDQLFGDPGNDILVGGDGNDKLCGSAGRDILIGSNGVDQLIGETADDILIGGSTTYDENPSALAAILTEWTSNTAYNFRVSRIRSGGGANGTFTLNSGTVLDDGAADTLFGDIGQDWFFIGSRDNIRDRANNELIN
jgi:hypothetical protein